MNEKLDKPETNRNISDELQNEIFKRIGAYQENLNTIIELAAEAQGGLDAVSYLYYLSKKFENK